MSRPAVAEYAFLHARLGARKAELLPLPTWELLLQAPAFAEQRQVLQTTCYAADLDRTAESTARRLRGAPARLVRVLEQALPAAAARFVRRWNGRDVLRNVKTILRGKALGRPPDALAGELLPVSWPPRFPRELLLASPGVEAALDLLETTDLRPAVREARRFYRRDPTLFGLDAALDRLFFRELAREVEQLAAPDRAAARGLVSRALDQVNLLWLMRYRLNYGLSPAEAYYLLVPATGRLGAEPLKELARQDTLDAMLARLTVEPYRRLLRPCRSVAEVETVLERYRARQAQDVLRHAPFTVAEAVALLEGRRLGVDREIIRSQLISPGGLAGRERDHAG